MKRLFVLLWLFCAAILSKAQTQQYGIIDTADLKLTSCDFEKGANAMVLFDKAEPVKTLIFRKKNAGSFNSGLRTSLSPTVGLYYNYNPVKKQPSSLNRFNNPKHH